MTQETIERIDIHREAFFKELTKERLITVIEYFEDVLSSFVIEE